MLHFYAVLWAHIDCRLKEGYHLLFIVWGVVNLHMELLRSQRSVRHTNLQLEWLAPFPFGD
jgi:hypothetical protein